MKAQHVNARGSGGIQIQLKDRKEMSPNT